MVEWEIVNGKPRKVHYLGYPGNYGFIPQTSLSKDRGGDGDPADILLTDPAVEEEYSRNLGNYWCFKAHRSQRK